MRSSAHCTRTEPNTNPAAETSSCECERWLRRPQEGHSERNGPRSSAKHYLVGTSVPNFDASLADPRHSVSWRKTHISGYSSGKDGCSIDRIALIKPARVTRRGLSGSRLHVFANDQIPNCRMHLAHTVTSESDAEQLPQQSAHAGHGVETRLTFIRRTGLLYRLVWPCLASMHVPPLSSRTNGSLFYLDGDFLDTAVQQLLHHSSNALGRRFRERHNFSRSTLASLRCARLHVWLPVP